MPRGKNSFFVCYFSCLFRIFLHFLSFLLRHTLPFTKSISTIRLSLSFIYTTDHFFSFLCPPSISSLTFLILCHLFATFHLFLVFPSFLLLFTHLLNFYLPLFKIPLTYHVSPFFLHFVSHFPNFLSFIRILPFHHLSSPSLYFRHSSAW